MIGMAAFFTVSGPFVSGVGESKKMNPFHKKKRLVEHLTEAGPDGPPDGSLFEHPLKGRVLLEPEGPGAPGAERVHVIIFGRLDVLDDGLGAAGPGEGFPGEGRPGGGEQDEQDGPDGNAGLFFHVSRVSLSGSFVNQALARLTKESGVE